jgi:outer membrane protein OmpA-like peptidoglycan-associated protein
MKFKFATPVLIFSFAVLLISPLAAEIWKVPVSEEVEVEGIIVEMIQEGFQMHTHGGRVIQVLCGEWSDIKEKKKNPFRDADQFRVSDLIPGLNVRVEGQGDTSGMLIGNKIRFTRDELKVARTISSSLTTTENKLEATENKLEAIEGRLTENQERTDGKLNSLESRSNGIEQQVEELESGFRLARREAADADKKAEGAIDRIKDTEMRILDLDDYNLVEKLEVQFDFNSSELSDDAKLNLDAVVGKMKDLDGYLIEVVGFASSDGDADYNRRLSQRRAEAVTRHLTEENSVPLWRMVQPYGFGESQPVGDNSSLEGRKRNRRVEVRLLQSQGIAGTSS